MIEGTGPLRPRVTMQPPLATLLAKGVGCQEAVDAPAGAPNRSANRLLFGHTMALGMGIGYR